MKIETFVTGIIGTNTYVAYNETTKEAVLVDPAACTKKLMHFIEEEGLSMKAVLLTHGHFDHIGGLEKTKAQTGAKVYIYADDADTLTSAGKNLSTMVGQPMNPGPADVLLRDGDEVEISPNIKLTTIHTPGHTVGSCCFVGEDVIFSGDTLFEGSIGRTDFPGGSYENMMKSLSRLMTYDDDMTVLPGHGENTDIAYERARNPFIARG